MSEDLIHTMLQAGTLLYPIKDKGKKFVVINSIDISLKPEEFSDENSAKKMFDHFSNGTADAVDLSNFVFYAQRAAWWKLQKMMRLDRRVSRLAENDGSVSGKSFYYDYTDWISLVHVLVMPNEIIMTFDLLQEAKIGGNTNDNKEGNNKS